MKICNKSNHILVLLDIIPETPQNQVEDKNQPTRYLKQRKKDQKSKLNSKWVQ